MSQTRPCNQAPILRTNRLWTRLVAALIIFTGPANASLTVIHNNPLAVAYVDAYLVFDVVPGDPRTNVLASDSDGEQAFDLPAGSWSGSAIAEATAESDTLYSYTRATASLTQTILEDGYIAGSGSIAALWNNNVGATERGYPGGFVDANSQFIFSIDEPNTYSLAYTLTCCNTEIAVYSRGDTQSLLFRLQAPFPSSISGTETGELPAGEYLLQAMVGYGIGDNPPGEQSGAYDFSMQLAPVPAPPTLGLLASGLLALLRRVWRQRLQTGRAIAVPARSAQELGVAHRVVQYGR